MHRLPVLLLLCVSPLQAAAQQIVTSARPDRVEVTVYRAPGRPPEQAFDLSWLRGYALISETRQITLPAGESEIRFEGVAGSILPQSAIVRGFPEGIVERNRDALLLSADSLLDRSLGRRVHLRRTSVATGRVTEQEAVVRSGADGAVVLQTAEGFETLRCTGLPETLVYDRVPTGLSARPTLSVRARTSAPVTATVTLAYLAQGFDWQANYIATLAPDGRSLRLFAWVTLANGDETSFTGANAQAVAGRINREPIEIDDNVRGRINRVVIEDGEVYEDGDDPAERALQLRCWPWGTTSSGTVVESQDIRLEGRTRTENFISDSVGYAGGDEEQAVMVTGTRVVQEELGDLKLYRIPIPVTVAARSQKQVAFLEQPRVRVETLYRSRDYADGTTGPEAATRYLVTRNRREEGLGMPLPAGGVQLFVPSEGRPILIGEGSLRDRAIGEDVEIAFGEAPGITYEIDYDVETDDDINDAYILTVTNDQPRPIRYEMEFQSGEDMDIRATGARLLRRNGMSVWQVTVPANGTRTLRYRAVERETNG